MIPRRLALLVAILAPLATAYSEGGYWKIDVNTDMTPAGRAAPHPSPGNPVYYLPKVGGYQEQGRKVAGEVPPPQKDVIHKLAAVLASEGYLASQLQPLTQATGSGAPPQMGLYPPPSIILVLNWGTMNPITLDMSTDPSDPNGPDTVTVNQKQMTLLTGGSGMRNMAPGFELDDVIQGAAEDRYFVVVEAYDFKSYVERHKKLLLWITKMSVASDGLTMPLVMPTLIASGGPLLGRETVRPKQIAMPAVPNGTVEVGEPEVKGYLDAPPPPPKAPAKK